MPWYIWRGWWIGSVWVFRVIILIIVVWIVLRAASRAHEGRAEGRVTPEEILRERYARGEIDTEEFQRRLAVLRAR
jgi:putative membrane protein